MSLLTKEEKQARPEEERRCVSDAQLVFVDSVWNFRSYRSKGHLQFWR